MKAYEHLIPAALAAVEKHLTDKNGTVPSVYRGYASAFGSILVNNGLLPALAIYETSRDKTAGERPKIAACLRDIMGPSGKQTLLKLAMDAADRRRFMLRLHDAIGALKLALGTFTPAAKEEKHV